MKGDRGGLEVHRGADRRSLRLSAAVQKAGESERNQRFEWEKWDVAANTNYYPINGVSQALYRIYQSQYGDLPIWHETDKKRPQDHGEVRGQRINNFPLTRHRVIAWSCAPLYYSNWCTWAYNCWGLNTVMNMDSLMFDMTLRTDSYEHTLEDMATYHEWAPMRRMAVGGMHHIFELWENMERFHCDMVMMYDQLLCKGMQGVHGLFGGRVPRPQHPRHLDAPRPCLTRETSPAPRSAASSTTT